MARRIHYRLSRYKRPRRSRPWILLALVVLSTAGWLWWRHVKRRKTGPPPVAATPKQQVLSPVPTKPSKPAKPSAAEPKPNLTNTAPARSVQPLVVETRFPRAVRDGFEAQVALARRAISPGSIDGVIGSQTRAALLAFQRKTGLPQTGALDADTRAALQLARPPLTTYVITSNDLARLQPLSKTWLGKSQQTALDYETILELVAEKSCSHPGLIRQLNPSVDWANVVAGTEVRLPDVSYPASPEKAAFVVIRLSGKVLEAFDAATNLLAHFPCSIAARVEKRPVGELHVAVIAPNPNYTFDPEIFPESAEGRELGRKLVLPPGPNNPVGVAWIGLDKPGYGMHGTPAPEAVGRTESHGCFRLANWNAEYLLKLVWLGMPVYVEP